MVTTEIAMDHHVREVNRLSPCCGAPIDQDRTCLGETNYYCSACNRKVGFRLPGGKIRIATRKELPSRFAMTDN